jgi:hypothetical protein
MAMFEAAHLYLCEFLKGFVFVGPWSTLKEPRREAGSGYRPRHHRELGRLSIKSILTKSESNHTWLCRCDVLLETKEASGF